MRRFPSGWERRINQRNEKIREKQEPVNKANLGLRFMLEMAAIITFGIWGFSLTASGTRIVYAILLPLIFASLWGVFAVRNDPSRSGKTVIQTPGFLRLLLELSLFGAATWMLFDLGFTIPGYILGATILFHYILSFKRIRWLLKQN